METEKLWKKIVSTFRKKQAKLISVMENKELQAVYSQGTYKIFSIFSLFLSLPVEIYVIKMAIFL